jgi:hypothetical protein
MKDSGCVSYFEHIYEEDITHARGGISVTLSIPAMRAVRNHPLLLCCHHARFALHHHTQAPFDGTGVVALMMTRQSIDSETLQKKPTKHTPCAVQEDVVATGHTRLPK